MATKGCEIYEMKPNNVNKLLVQGHYAGELWGAAFSPKDYKFATCGGDSTIRIWDAK